MTKIHTTEADSRTYFLFGDILANVVTGALAAWVCAALVPQSWNMFAAMIIAMAVGMLLALLLFFPFGYFFGAMEVMVPIMFSGMVAGMVVGMQAAMEPVGSGEALRTGAIIGLLCLGLIKLIDTRLRGPVERHK